MLIYGVVWSVLEVEVGCMLEWKTTMLEWVTQLIYEEFRSLLEVGTLTPNPVQVRFMLV